MQAGSLRLRLIVSAALAISLALALAGLIFYWQFQKHVERLALNEMDAYFEQLVAGLTFTEDGKLEMEDELTDPRFSKQYGGMYWQIDIPNAESLRSRSLWDGTLGVPTPPENESEVHMHELTGPDGAKLLSSERRIDIEKPGGGKQTAVVTVAVDRRNTSNAISAFGSDIAKGLSLLYVALMLSSFAQIQLGLRPLREIRTALSKIRDGREKRLAGDFPTELNPMVSEMNGLLSSRDKQIERTRQRAGNLAHGLKTPLTVIEAIANDLTAKNIKNSTGEILETTRDMRNLVERELARARMSAGHTNALIPLLPVVDRIANAMKKTSRSNPKEWTIAINPDDVIAMEPDDLTEMLGNLLENALLHAKSKIRISFANGALSIEDDGKGVPEDKLPDIFKRGVRLDQHKPGSGLGLAIVQDVADAYGAEVLASRSLMGGLKVTISPPSGLH